MKNCSQNNHNQNFLYCFCNAILGRTYLKLINRFLHKKFNK